MRFLAYTQFFSIISTFASSWIIFSIFGGCNNRGNFFLYFVFEFFYHTVCVERMELIFVPMFLSLGCCIINPIFQCRIIYQKKCILYIRRIINYSHSPLCGVSHIGHFTKAIRRLSTSKKT